MARYEWLKKLELARFSQRERWLMILTAAALVVFFLRVLYLPLHWQVSPLVQEYEHLSREVRELERQLDEARKASELMKARNPPAVETVVGGSASGEQDLVPRARGLALILEELNRLAKATAVDFLLVRPEAMQDSGILRAQPVLMDVRSTFKGMGRYLQMMENLPRLINVENIKIDADPAEASYVLVHLYLTVYLEKD